jgi:hypothetical protein
MMSAVTTAFDSLSCRRKRRRRQRLRRLEFGTVREPLDARLFGAPARAGDDLLGDFVPVDDALLLRFLVSVVAAWIGVGVSEPLELLDCFLLV